MDLERARRAAEKANSKQEMERQRFQQQAETQETLDRFHAAWNAWAGTWENVVLSRQERLFDEAGQKDLANALAGLVEVTRERGLIDSLPIALAKYDPVYCDGTEDEEEAHGVGVLIDALTDVVDGRPVDEVAAELLSLDPLAPLIRAGSARWLLYVAENWPTHCEVCGRIQPPGLFHIARCRECSKTDGKLVLLVNHVWRVERSGAEADHKTAEVFPFWPKWREALLLAFPGVMNDSELCSRLTAYLTEKLGLKPQRWQGIDLAEAERLLPAPVMRSVSHEPQAEIRLNGESWTNTQHQLRVFGDAAKLVATAQVPSDEAWRKTMAAIRQEADAEMQAELLPMLEELRKVGETGLSDLIERGFPTMRTVEQCVRLARIVECPLIKVRNGSLSANAILEHAIKWAARKRVDAKLPGNSAGSSAEIETPPSDDALPKSKRAKSPSRIKARSAYDYAMERIADANVMTAAELFDAILKDGEAAQMLPSNAAAFRRYLNDCGIRLRKGGPKSSGGSVVRWSDF